MRKWGTMIIDFFFIDNTRGTYIGRIGDQFSDEYFLVRVEGIDNQAHQLSDLGLEGEGLNLICIRHAYVFWHFFQFIIQLNVKKTSITAELKSTRMHSRRNRDPYSRSRLA